jgi:hypothetical protein
LARFNSIRVAAARVARPQYSYHTPAVVVTTNPAKPLSVNAKLLREHGEKLGVFLTFYWNPYPRCGYIPRWRTNVRRHFFFRAVSKRRGCARLKHQFTRTRGRAEESRHVPVNISK